MDTAICCHSVRLKWLQTLQTTFNDISAKIPDFHVSNDKMIEWLVLKNARLESVAIDGKVTNDGISKLAKLCYTSLKSIKFSSIGSYDTGIQYISGYCFQLQTIELVSANLTDKSLISIGTGCQELKSICVGFHCKVTNIGLGGLLRNCSNLIRFIFYTIEDFENKNKIFFYLGPYCPLLEFLAFNGVEITDSYESLFTVGFKNLKSLIFPGIDNKMSNCLRSNLGSLEEFEFCTSNFEDSYTIADSTFKIFTTGCPLLHTIICSYHTISLLGVRSLIEYCPLLKKLDITGSSIHDDSLAEIGKLSSKLKILDITSLVGPFFMFLICNSARIC